MHGMKAYALPWVLLILLCLPVAMVLPQGLTRTLLVGPAFIVGLSGIVYVHVVYIIGYMRLQKKSRSDKSNE